MLSYKEYKLLNESLYGAFNLGLRSHGTVGGIVSGSSVNGTEAAIEAEAEEAIEEAKKMKKKMEDDEEEEEGDEDLVDNPEKSEDDDSDDEDDSEDEDSEEEDSEEEDEDEDEDEEESEDAEKKDFAFMKKKMKKKAKKEWSEVMSDLESVLEVVDDEEALTEVKKGLEMMKKGMEKGMGDGCKKCGKYMNEGKKHAKSHKPDCDCPVCEKKHDEKGEDEGLTAGQKKLPKALRDAILAKKGKGEKKCGKMMDKKMDEADQAWWNSVNDMLGTADQKGWDGWTEVGEVQQAVREGEQIDEGILQDIGNSKFVRSAVTAAGLGAAALGGYGAMRGSKGGVPDASMNRTVASQKADDANDDPTGSKKSDEIAMANRVRYNNQDWKKWGDEVDWDEVPGRGYGPNGDRTTSPGQPGSGYQGSQIRTRRENAISKHERGQRLSQVERDLLANTGYFTQNR
jgi:hypothetical protein